MYLIGLTGGIAAGKSTVAKRLGEHGAVIIDADELARRVVAPGTTGLADIRREFGANVIAADGSLDRAALAAVIFSSPERRETLNAIIHPAVKTLAHDLIAQADDADPQAIVVYDVPLLVEASADADREFDLIVVVHAKLEVRIRRLIELRGLTRQEAVHRLNSQATDTERLAIADVVIDNSGAIDETLRQVDALWNSVSAHAV